MLKLDTLSTLIKKRKRIGRGGDRGGTSGRGHKGQKARTSGTTGISFEGGQMPLIRRIPKRGFNNKRFQDDVRIMNLEQLNNFFESGATVNKELLVERGIIKGGRNFSLKILGKGDLTKKLIVYADAFSATAETAIKNVGGEAHVNQER